MLIWKSVRGLYGYYEVSSNGDVKSIERVITHRSGKRQLIREKILKPKKTSDGYYNIHLRKEGFNFHKRVHVLVAESFIPNFYRKTIVNHKNGIRNDNRANNLEWVTPMENMIHSHKILGNKTKYGKKIFQFTLDGDFVKEWANLAAIKNDSGLDRKQVNDTLLGLQKTACGFAWFREGDEFNWPDLSPEKLESLKRRIYGRTPVNQLSLSGTFIKKWDSLTEAASAISGQTTKISQVALGRRKTHKGFVWEYAKI